MITPLRLTLGLRDGTELAATSLRVLNATCVMATLPPWPGATAYAWADVALSDAQGRTAFLYAAFLYEPGWQPYATTAALLAAIVMMACWLIPVYLRRGCESSREVRAVAASRECV